MGELCTFADRIVALASGLALAQTPQEPPAAWPHDKVFHAWWAEPGRLLAGEYPGSLDPAHRDRKLSVLMDWGVRTIVDLTTPRIALSRTPIVSRSWRGCGAWTCAG